MFHERRTTNHGDALTSDVVKFVLAFLHAIDVLLHTNQLISSRRY